MRTVIQLAALELENVGIVVHTRHPGIQGAEARGVVRWRAA